MVNLREAQDILLHCHVDNLINDEEFILLYDVTEPANPEFPYWTYPPFNLETFSDDECNAEFRFSKNNIYSLVDALRIPDEVRCPNRQSVDGVEALCVLLKRNSYPCRFSDLIPAFGRSVTELCNIASVTRVCWCRTLKRSTLEQVLGFYWRYCQANIPTRSKTKIFL